MSTDIQPRETETDEKSISSLMKSILTDVEKLIGQQLALVRREVQEDLRQACAATGIIAFGGSIVLIAGVTLAFGAVYAIHEAAPDWSWGSCFTLVGVCLAIVGGLMLWGGAQLFNTINPVPDRSMEALQENVKCLTNPQTCQTPPPPKTSNAK